MYNSFVYAFINEDGIEFLVTFVCCRNLFAFIWCLFMMITSIVLRQEFFTKEFFLLFNI